MPDKFALKTDVADDFLPNQHAVSSADNKDGHSLALSNSVNEKRSCVIHNSDKHSLNDCKKFCQLPHAEKINVLKRNRLCFQCHGNHLKSACTVSVKCSKCRFNHLTSMHYERSLDQSPNANSETNLCTKVNRFVSGSCSKTVLVDLSLPGVSGETMRCYAIIDEQSTSTFAHPKVAQFFGVTAPVRYYSLNTLSGFETKMQCVTLTGLKVKGVKENTSFFLPATNTNPHIPDCKHEVASKDTVRGFHHLRHLADNFCDLDQSAEVLLLVGRDAGRCMYTRCFGNKPPFAHHTALGWAVVGETCSSKPNFNPCTLKTSVCSHFSLKPELSMMKPCTREFDIFQETKDDELTGTSQEDDKFLKIVEDDNGVNKKGNTASPSEE